RSRAWRSWPPCVCPTSPGSASSPAWTRSPRPSHGSEPMSTIEIREPPKRRAFRGLRAIALLNRALVAALMLGGVLVVDVSVFDDPPFVERLAFDNPSEYQIDVALSASGSTDTLPVGVAVQRCIAGYESIIDQGS